MSSFTSYEAAEDNEISFLEGDRITQIEAVMEEWWEGTLADGRRGLFPGERLEMFRSFRSSNSIRS